MQILKALKPGVVQSVAHVLEAMEADGVVSISDAKKLVTAALTEHHTKLQQPRRRHVDAALLTCPGCGLAMTPYHRQDESGDKWVVWQCDERANGKGRGCRFSMLRSQEDDAGQP